MTLDHRNTSWKTSKEGESSWADGKSFCGVNDMRWTEDTGFLMASNLEEVKLGDHHPLLRPPVRGILCLASYWGGHNLGHSF